MTKIKTNKILKRSKNNQMSVFETILIHHLIKSQKE